MRTPEYTRALTDDTTLSVLQGDEQTPYPIKFSKIKSGVLGGFTQGSVLFAGAGGVVSEDAGVFNYDPTNKIFNVGSLSNSNTSIQIVSSSFSADNTKGLVFTRGSSSFNFVNTGTLDLVRSGSVITRWNTDFNFSVVNSLNVGKLGTPSARLDVKGSGTTSSTYTAQFHNSTGTSNSLVVRDDGRSIFGGNNPLAQVHIKGGSTLSSAISGTQLLLEGFSSTILQLAAHSTGNIIVAFGDQDDGTDAQIAYSNVTRAMTFEVANAPRYVISSTGQGTWTNAHTALANNDYGWNFTGSLTARATASDTLNGVLVNPTLNAGANNQVLTALRINSSLLGGIYTGISAWGIYDQTTRSSFEEINIRRSLSDVRNNGILTQSASGVITNRTATFLNATYSSLYIPSPVNLGLGISSGVAARLHVQGSGTTSATYTAQFHNSTGTSKSMLIYDDGSISFGRDAISPYQITVNNDIYVINGVKVGSSTTYVGKMWNNGGVLSLESDFNRDIRLGSNNFPDAVYVEGTNGNVGIGATTPTSKTDINGTNGYNQLRLRTTYTPTGTADANGNIGDTAWDDNYLYMKTSAGWKRTALSTF